MSILSGFKKYKDYILTDSGYQLSSRWTSSESIIMGDGTDDSNTLEKNLGSVNGITDSLTSTNSNVALSSAAGKNLQDQITSVNSQLGNLKVQFVNFTNMTLDQIRGYAKQNDKMYVGFIDWESSVKSPDGNTSLLFVADWQVIAISVGTHKVYTLNNGKWNTSSDKYETAIQQFNTDGIKYTTLSAINGNSLAKLRISESGNLWIGKSSDSGNTWNGYSISEKLSNLGKQYWSGIKTLNGISAETGVEFAPITLDPGCYIVKAGAVYTNVPDNTQLYTSIAGTTLFGGAIEESTTAKSGNANMGVVMHISITTRTTFKTRVWSKVALTGTIYAETSAMRIA